MRSSFKKLLLPLLLATTLLSQAKAADPITIKWLDTPTPIPSGISFGVPFPKSTIQKSQPFSLSTPDGKSLPLQSWPLAYWPDGSLKWSAFATLTSPTTTGPLTLTPTNDAPTTQGITVTQTNDAIDINTSPPSPPGTPTTPGLTCHISKALNSQNLFESLSINNRTIATNAHLELILQNGPESDPASPAPRERFTSLIQKITLEQSGPVRAVVKFEGFHKSLTSSRQWLPFTVRLYFYPGITPIRLVHSIVFDGDSSTDFIRGLGVTMTVPMNEELQNRHVRFGGQDGGLWAEPVEPISGWQIRFTDPTNRDPYAAQLAGQPLPNRAKLNPQSVTLLDSLAKWNDFRLIQPNAQGFTIEKRTSDKSSWLPTGSGTRASGLVYVGDTSGGLALGIQNFWQSYPASLEVDSAVSDTAHIHAWLWSPDAPAMDLRHYDTVAHGLNATYEDVQPGFSTPYGIARTSVLTLFPSASVPTKEESAKQAQLAAAPPLLVCTPQYLHDVKAFGIWSLQDRSTPYKKQVEDNLDQQTAFYEKEVDQYNWYGFWNFGNVMHAYDATRHTWKYDLGGFAWDNSEQGTDMVAWYSFLRTGRADIFRFAEAMTRCTGETICYHIGPMAGLGSRHNVIPFGDGAKEARIAMAPYRRFYYYLTTDERTGDIMHEMLQSEESIKQIDPMREVLPPTEADKQFPARVRAGPDWFAFLGNWMTEWERTGDTKYRDKILAGVDSINAMPYWMKTSQDLLWGFYPDTGKLVPRDLRQGSYNLVNNMGGPEIVMELNDMLDNPTWDKIWLQYCRLSNAPGDMIQKDKETGTEGATGQYSSGGRFAGYVYYKTHNLAYAQRAVAALTNGPTQFNNVQHLDGPDLMKPIDFPQNLNGLVTNDVNQATLNLIEVLELCKDQLPQNPVIIQTRGGPRGGRRGPPATAPASVPAGEPANQ